MLVRSRRPGLLALLAVLADDATMLLATAMRDGARTREALRACLADVGSRRATYQGLSGPIAFGSAGDVRRAHQWAEVRPEGVRALASP